MECNGLATTGGVFRLPALPTGQAGGKGRFFVHRCSLGCDLQKCRIENPGYIPDVNANQMQMFSSFDFYIHAYSGISILSYSNIYQDLHNNE